MKKRPLHVIEQPSEDGTNISSSKNSNKKRHVEVSITSDSESNIESESDNDTVLETGQIISVAVENFMCHRYFEVKFGENLNFITGANGSGKSAIVTALQICLGLNAKSTKRGNKLSDLIREGSNEPAVVRVTLRNTGADSYMHDKYGDRIIVERKIVRNGSSTFRLLSENKIVISESRSDLDSLLRSLNIFVDNPCCILTQEDAKKFIQGSNKDKYSFFLRGTGLFQTKEELESSWKNIEKIKSDLNEIERIVVLKEEVMNDAQKGVDLWHSLDVYDEKIKRLEVDKKWKAIQSKKSIIADQMKKKIRLLSAFEKEKNRLRSLEEELSEATSLLRSHSTLATIDDEKQSILQSIEAISTAILEKKSLISRCDRRLGEFNISKSGLSKEIKSIQSEISKAQDRINSYEEEYNALTSRYDKMVGAVELVESKLLTLKSEKIALLSQRDSIKDKNDEIVRRSNQIKDILHRKKREKEELQHSNQGNEALYGRHMTEMLQLIARSRHRFRGEVWGPLGIHIKLRNGREESAQAVERNIGSVLASFVVTNREDERILRELGDSLRANLSIVIQSQSPRYKWDSYTLQSKGIITVIECIDVEKDLIFNCVVDQCQSERIAVVDDEEDCSRRCVVRDNEGRLGLISELKQAITLDGITIKYVRGNQSSEANFTGFKRFLSRNIADAVNDVNAQIEQLLLDYDQLMRQKAESDQELSRVASNIRSTEIEITRCMSQLSSENCSKRECQEKLKDLQEFASGDCAQFEKEKRDLESKLEDLSRSLESENSTKQKFLEELEELACKKKELERKRLDILDKYQREEQIITDFIEKRRTLTDSVSQLQREVETKQQVLNEISTTIQNQEENCQSLCDDAIAFTKETIPDWNGDQWTVDPHITLADIERQLTTMKETRQTRQVEVNKELEGRTLEYLEKDLESKRRHYEEAVTRFGELGDHLELLESEHQMRQEKWKESLRKSSKLVARNFDNYLQEKGFAGTVKFNHQAHEMIVTSQIDNRDDNTRSSDLRELSGGERSFTGLCLLLAFGHVMHSPFRLFDEYDVFLDEVSRKVTLDQIRRHALHPSNAGRQMIVITPHSLGHIKTSSKVRIEKMVAPQRVSSRGMQQSILS